MAGSPADSSPVQHIAQRRAGAGAQKKPRVEASDRAGSVAGFSLAASVLISSNSFPPPPAMLASVT